MARMRASQLAAVSGRVCEKWVGTSRHLRGLALQTLANEVKGGKNFGGGCSFH